MSLASKFRANWKGNKSLHNIHHVRVQWSRCMQVWISTKPASTYKVLTMGADHISLTNRNVIKTHIHVYGFSARGKENKGCSRNTRKAAPEAWYMPSDPAPAHCLYLVMFSYIIDFLQQHIYILWAQLSSYFFSSNANKLLHDANL